MSIATLPDDQYEDWYWRELKRNIDAGMFLDDARLRAREVMNQCARRLSDQIQCESQKDYYDERDGDWTR